MQACFSLEFGVPARRPDGSTNGAAKPANAVACKKRRRDKGGEAESIVEGDRRGLVFIGKAEHGLPDGKFKSDSRTQDYREWSADLQNGEVKESRNAPIRRSALRQNKRTASRHP